MQILREIYTDCKYFIIELRDQRFTIVTTAINLRNRLFIQRQDINQIMMWKETLKITIILYG